MYLGTQYSIHAQKVYTSTEKNIPFSARRSECSCSSCHQVELMSVAVATRRHYHRFDDLPPGGCAMRVPARFGFLSSNCAPAYTENWVNATRWSNNKLHLSDREL